MKLSKKFVAISVFVWLLCGSNVYAVTLNEALVSTYNNNDKMKNDRVEFIDSLEQFSKALAGFLPDVNAKIELDDINAKTVGRFSDGSPARQYKTLQRTLTVGQKIFNGGSDMARLKGAQEGFKAARAKLYENEQQVLYSAISVYLDYQEAKTIYDISDASVNFYTKSYESIEAKFKVGEATKTDLAIAESQLSKAKSDRSQNYASLESAKAKFKRISGLDSGPSAKVDVPELPAHAQELLNKTLARNWGLASAKHSLSAAKAGVNAAAGNLLPTLTAQVSIGRNYNDPELGASSANTNSLNCTTVLRLDIPILSNGGAEYSRVRNARNASRRAALSIDNAMKELESNVVSLWESYVSADSALKSASLAVSAQEIALEGMTQEFNVGIKTIIDVLNVENQLTTLKMNQAKIHKQHLLVAYQIRSLVGDLTARNLGLSVKYFDPDAEFKKIKMKIVGF